MKVSNNISGMLKALDKKHCAGYRPFVSQGLLFALLLSTLEPDIYQKKDKHQSLSRVNVDNLKKISKRQVRIRIFIPFPYFFDRSLFMFPQSSFL